MSSSMPVDGPHRMYVRRIPSGVELDVSHLVGTLLTQLARDFEEEPEAVAQDLMDIAELARSAQHQGPDSHATHERDHKVEQLLDTLGGAVQLVYGAQATRFADALRAAVAPKAVPTQCQAGAA